MSKATLRDCVYMGDLPDGYDYKLFLVDGEIRILGIHQDKRLIGFVVDKDKLRKIDFEIYSNQK